MTVIDSVVEVQVAGRDGKRFLLADPGSDPMRPARVHDLDTGRITADQPLQVWFKWACWDAATEVDYHAAQQEVERARA